MKRLIYYAGMMVVVVILVPMAIVRGCERPPKTEPPEKITVTVGHKISVYNKAFNKTEIMDLEEYLKGVVAAEMPADFDMEALKAQAVAARTFAYGRLCGVYCSKQGVHDGTDICTDPSHCQAWTSRESAIKKWSVLFAAGNWAKIEKAVDETKDMIVTYHGSIANTLFHASSCGMTENSEDVWAGVKVPYLRSVVSDGDQFSKGYAATILMGTGEMAEKLRKAYPDADVDSIAADSIKILDYTASGRVKTLKIGNVMMKGTEFRSLFGLRSASFDVKPAEDDMLKITTTGYGHGVGMSQWGADSLAKKGGAFREILEHYYTGVDILTISDYERLAKAQ